MPQTSSIASTEPAPGWTAPELARFKAYMGDNWLPPADIGHNSEPGPDHSHRIGFHIPEYVSRDRVKAFERILQEQGKFADRLAALDQAAYRARADKNLSARAYRVYEAVLDASRGAHRCCLLDLDKIGYLARVDRTAASRVISELEDSGHVATLRFTEGPVGAPTARRLFIAPIITPEDRARLTTDRLYAEADAAKLDTLRKRAESTRNRRQREVSEARSCQGDNYNDDGGNGDVVVDRAATGSCRDDNDSPSVVVKTRFRSCLGDNSVIHNKDTIEERGADAPTPPPSAHAIRRNEAPPSPRTPSAALPSHPQTPPLDGDAQAPNGGGARRARAGSAAVSEAEQAIEIYNAEARRHGWIPCENRSATRLVWLKKRLTEIGGLQPWQKALSAIPGNDWMMGRVTPKDGQKGFKLDIGYLVHTNGNRGDVLAHLLDVAAATPEPPWWKDPAKLAAMSEQRWRAGIAEHTQGDSFWPIEVLGPSPGSPNCVVPRHLVDELGLTEIYDEHGLRRRRA
jgi:hypothetical protein